MSQLRFFVKLALIAILGLAMSADLSYARGGRGGGGYGGYHGGGYGGYHGGGGYGGYHGGYGGWGGGWGWGVGLGWGGPWYGGGWGYGYPSDYAYYYPDSGSYYYSYPTQGTVIPNSPITPPQAPAAPTSTSTSSSDQQAGNEAMQEYSEAREAFLQGNYAQAWRDASHAAIDAPQNPKPHELISLALFAQGNYPAAASAAHAALALGAPAEWKDLYSYYNNAETYTNQLRALEKASSADPNSAADHFMLGYHYLMTGARNNAKAEFADAAKLTSNDKLAGHILQELQSNAAVTPPQTAARPDGQAR